MVSQSLKMEPKGEPYIISISGGGTILEYARVLRR